MNPIENFQHALELKEELYKENADLIERWEKIKTLMAECEEDVKKLCKENKDGVEIDNTVFTYQPVYKKWIDYAAALKAIGKDRKTILDEISTIKNPEVDIKKFVSLCREGIFPEEARIAAYREEEMSPRVVITFKT